MVFLYIPSPPMQVQQTQQKHLGSLLSLMFCLKFTGDLPFIFSSNCRHNHGPLQVTVSSPRYSIFDNQLPRSLGFWMLFWVFLNINIPFIIGGDKPFRQMITSVISCCFLNECFLRLVCSKVRQSWRLNHFNTIVKTGQVVVFYFSIRPSD